MARTLYGNFVNATWSSSSNWVDSLGNNYSPGDGDTLLLVSNAIAAVTGSDETSTKLHSLYIGPDFTASLGSSGAYLQLSVDRLNYASQSQSAWIALKTHAYTDLAIDASDDTVISSAALPFTSNDVGKTIVITGGTGFTTGSYIIQSVASGDATLDSAVGTTSSTGGTGQFEIDLNIKSTYAIDPDDIATNGLHIKPIGAANLLDPKFAGYVTLHAETSTGSVVGDLYCAALLMANYATLDNADNVILAPGVSALMRNYKPLSSTNSTVIDIRNGATYAQYQTTFIIPLSGPDIIVNGGTLNWFASAIINTITGNSGSIDFSEAIVPFQIDSTVLIKEATLNIANGLRTPTFGGSLQFRGKAPAFTFDGNVNMTLSYV